MSKEAQRTIIFNVRLPEAEHQMLKSYAEKTGRTLSDVVREFIRSLQKK